MSSFLFVFKNIAAKNIFKKIFDLFLTYVNIFNMITEIKNSMVLSNSNLINTNSLNLAFMGDGVWTCLVREYFCVNTNFKNNNLHKFTTKFVKATFQAKMIDFLKDDFTETELNLVRRARNTKVNTASKNATLSEYKKATGFEAVIGYLYFSNNFDRIKYFFNKIKDNFFKED